MLTPLPMSFNIPSQERPRSEAERLKDEIDTAVREIRAMDPDAPEMAWLKEKLQELDARLHALEAPKLRTPESYGAPAKESQVEKDMEAVAERIRHANSEDRVRAAS